MNKLRKINERIRKPRTVWLRCTATAANGESKYTEAEVKANRLNKLEGSALSGAVLYQLSKKGKAETTDVWGTKFLFEIFEKKEAKNEANTEVQLPEAAEPIQKT